MKKPIITVERRERAAAPEPKHKWLLPLLIGVAIAALLLVVIVASINGTFFP